MLTHAERNGEMWISFLKTKETLAHRIVEARKIRGTTQKVVHENKPFCVSRYTLMELENPHNQLDFLLWDIQKIANSLRVNIKDLFNPDPDFKISHEIYLCSITRFDRDSTYTDIMCKINALKELNRIVVTSIGLKNPIRVEQLTRIAYKLKMKPFELL